MGALDAVHARMMTTVSIAVPSSGTSIAAIVRPAAATAVLPQVSMARPRNSAVISAIAVRWYTGRIWSIEKIR
jgi:hypothetical protein